MGYAFCVGRCCACGEAISFNPLKVPSLRIDGERQPLCRNCFDLWNEIHRINQGLDPLPIHPDAYEPCNEFDLP